MRFLTRISFSLLLGVITTHINRGLCEKATSRAIDLSVAWRPLPQNSPSSALISVTSLDTTNKAELYKIAQHNAQVMRQIKGLTPPSTPYYNSYQSSTPSYHLHHHAQQQQNQQQKNNYGKQQFSNYYVNGIHSSTPKIPGPVKNVQQQYSNHFHHHQQQQQQQQQQHHQYQQQPQQHQQQPNQQQYNQGSFMSLSTTTKYRDASLTPPPKPTPKTPLQTSQHPVINKLQEHLALVTRQNKQPSTAQSIRLDNFALPESVLNSFSHFQPPILKSNSYSSNSISPQPVKHFYGNNFEMFSNNHYLPPSGSSGNTAESFVLQNLKNNGNNQVKISFQNTIREQSSFAPPFPSIPPSVLSPFFQQVQQQQASDNKYQGHKTSANNVEYTTYGPPNNQQIKVEINDEFTRNLVPPPHYKHTDSNNFRETVIARPNEDKANYDYFSKYNMQNVSPLQDANRFSYNSGSYKPTSNAHQISSSSVGLSSTTPSFTYANYLFPPSTDPPIDFNTFITTSKPNVFKQLSRPQESEYKQHKVMHPSYTGAKRPNDNQQDTTFVPTPNNSEHDNNSITHSFFTIEDAVTVVPSQTILTGSLSQNNQFIPSQNYQYDVEHFSHQDAKESNAPNETKQHVKKLETPVSEEVDEVYQYNFIASTVPPSTTPYVYTTPLPVTTTSTTTTTTAAPQTLPPPPASQQPQFNSIRPRDRTKLRRRRPRPRPTVAVEEPIDNDIRTALPTYEPPVQHAVNSQRNRQNRRPSTTTTENPPITSVYQPSQRHRRPGVQHVEQYLIETSPSPQTIRQRPQQPQISTTQETKQSHFLPTILADSVSINSERIKTTNSIPDETTIEIRPQTQFNRVRNPTTINYEDYTIPQTTNLYQQEADVAIDTTIANVPTVFATPTVENIGGDHIRHLGRFRYKENKLPTAVQEYNENETVPPVTRIHTKLTTVRSSTTTTTTQVPVTTTTTTEPTSSKPYGRVKSPYSVGNRPRFSVKEYRQKLHTSTTEPPNSGDSPTQNTHNRLRFPSRTRFVNDINRIRQRGDVLSSTTEAPVIESNNIEEEEVAAPVPVPVETSTESRKRLRQRPTVEPSTSTTSRTTSSRRGINTRRDFVNRTRPSTSTPRINTETPTVRNVSIALRRPATITLRQRIQNFRKRDEKLPTANDNTIDDIKPVADDSVTEEQTHVEQIVEMSAAPAYEQTSTDGYRHETSIMKIAKDDHSYRQHPTESTVPKIEETDTNDLRGSPSDYSQRVAELTISGKSAFKSVNTGMLSRRVPGYFTLATEDPILPIEAFFPQVSKE